MNICLTGGAGFIGSHLLDALLERGDTVVVIDNFNDYYSPAIKRSNLKQAANHQGFRLVEGDLLDDNVLNAAFDNETFDAIVHLAARAGVRPSLQDPILYEQVNGLGTLRMLEAARLNNVPHMVFASSSSVYGDTTEPPFKESVKIDRPISPYAATKAAGELYGHTYHHLYGIIVNALRFFTAYGPRGRPDMAIAKFTKMILEGTPIPFYGDGSTRRDYTYIDDIIQGVMAAIDKPQGFEVFNLGESATTTLTELVECLEDNLGIKAILDKQPAQPGDVTLTCADITKAQTQLGYAPSTQLAEGIKAYVAWYRDTHA